MNIEKLISSLPQRSKKELAQLRKNATNWLSDKNNDKVDAAKRLLDALDDLPKIERKAIFDKVEKLSFSRRVVEAFLSDPPTENEANVIRVILQNPSSTSAELSEALGWGGQTWHMHFGGLCKKREMYLWPAEKYEKKDARFWSGILAEIDLDTGRWKLRPEVAAAFKELGYG